MAKKLIWGKFSIDDLSLDKEDDIYAPFPFLNLVGMVMVKLSELRIGDNAEDRWFIRVSFLWLG